jgi:hypothetical protein
MTETPETTSLVERLLASDAASVLTNEAAREIERLRRIIEAVRRDILPHVRDTGHNAADREISHAAQAVRKECNP